MPDKQISSAGLAPVIDHGIEKSAASLLDENGYESKGHKARKLDRELINDSDLLLVMEKDHQYTIMKRYPQSSGKVMLLGKWSDDMEIIDPYQKSSEAFTHVFEQIEENCIRWIEKLSIQSFGSDSEPDNAQK